MSETKLNQTIIDKLVVQTLKGISVVSICALSGISRDSYYRWMKKGKQDIKEEVDSVFAQFVQSIQTAEAEVEERMLAQAIGEEEVGARWYLSRKMRDEYGDKQEIDIKGGIEVEITWPDEDEDNE